MKKIVITVLAALLSLSMYGADKKIPAVMLQSQGSLYEEKDGGMEWVKSLDLGTELEVLTVTNEFGEVVPEVKKSTRVVSKKTVDCTCYHVQYDGKKYWVLHDRISMNEKVAVITKDAAVYRSADVSDVKNSSLPLTEIITYGQIYEANNGKFKLYKISYFDEVNYVTRTGYVKMAKVSTAKDDITAVKMLQKIRSAKDENVRNELFKNLSKLNASSEIKTYAADLMKSYEPKDILDDGVDTVEAYFEVTNNADTKLNIRSLPNTNSDVIGQIEGDGDVVWVNSKTVATEKIGDSEKSWYNISYETDEDVITGWVFGAYLK